MKNSITIKGNRVEMNKGEYIALLNAFNVLSRIECCIEDVLCELQYDPVIDVFVDDNEEVKYITDNE